MVRRKFCVSSRSNYKTASEGLVDHRGFGTNLRPSTRHFIQRSSRSAMILMAGNLLAVRIDKHIGPLEVHRSSRFGMDGADPARFLPFKTLHKPNLLFLNAVGPSADGEVQRQSCLCPWRCRYMTFSTCGPLIAGPSLAALFESGLTSKV